MFRYTLLSKSKSSVYLSLQNATNQVIDHLGHLSGAVYVFAARAHSRRAQKYCKTAVRGRPPQSVPRRTPS